MYQKDCMHVLKGWMDFIHSWVNQLEHYFQVAVRALALFFMGFSKYVRFMGGG